MSKIKITLPGNAIPVDGKQVSFRAPCGCSEVDCLQIEGRDYSIVGATGESLTGLANAWAKDALVTVVLDVTNALAYVQNAAVAPGVQPVELGGTGASTAEQAVKNLGIVNVIVGTYTGNGTSQIINLGVRPKAVLITDTDYGATNSHPTDASSAMRFGGLVLDGIPILQGAIEIVETGFKLDSNKPTKEYFNYPNQSGKLRQYIAWY